MDFTEDDWECLEPDVENAVDERRIYVEDEDDGFSKAELEWANGGFKEDFLPLFSAY